MQPRWFGFRNPKNPKVFVGVKIVSIACCFSAPSEVVPSSDLATCRTLSCLHVCVHGVGLSRQQFARPLSYIEILDLMRDVNCQCI